MLSINIETGNIFYENYNTNESMYDFLLRQQDDTKKIIHTTITYRLDISWMTSMLKLLINLIFWQTKTLNIFSTSLMTICCLVDKTQFPLGTRKLLKMYITDMTRYCQSLFCISFITIYERYKIEIGNASHIRDITCRKCQKSS